MYKCQYCGGSVGVGEALDKHMGFRSICREKMNAAIKNYELEKASCTGCGAELIFDKGDAVANCAFCGRALVREAYVKPDNIPELIIPFSITNEEAQEILTDWCKKNASKKEAKALSRPETKPLFFMDIDGKREPVEIRFTTFYRMLRAFGLAFVVIFLPVIIALLLNGFNFSQLELGGSAAWFCLVVPLVPVFLVKFGRIDIYDNPWIYMVNDKGAKKRYKPKKEKTFTRKELAVTILKLLFVPPASFGVWFGIIIFCVMCYLTAFGFSE